MSVVSLFGAYRAPVYCAFALGLLLRVVFVLETPFNGREEALKLSAYNDEAAHVAYTMHLLETGSLPRATAPISSIGALPTWENYQSPVFYLIHAAACRVLRATSTNGVTLAGRLLSVLFMLLTFAVAFYIFKALGRTITSKGAALAIVFLSLSGVFVRFSALSGNELLAWLSAGWLVWAFVEYERYASTRTLAWLLIAFVLGIYVKLSLLLATPLIAIALYKTFQSSRGRAVIGSVYLIAGCLPLALYNYSTFGSAIPLAAGFGEAHLQVPNVSSLFFAARSAVFPWSEFWQGWKGAILFIPALIFVSAAFVGALSKLKAWHFAFTLSAVAGFVWLNFRYDQAEARYLFVAWPALLLGIERLPSQFFSPWALFAALLLPYTLFVF